MPQKAYCFLNLHLKPPHIILHLLQSSWIEPIISLLYTMLHNILPCYPLVTPETNKNLWKNFYILHSIFSFQQCDGK